MKKIPHYASLSIIGRQPPLSDDHRQRKTERLIYDGSQPVAGWLRLTPVPSLIIDPITLIEAAQQPLMIMISDPDAGSLHFSKVRGSFAVLFFKFPQFFETNEQLGKMGSILDSYLCAMSHEAIRTASLTLLSQHLQFCKNQMSTSMGLESLIGWNTTEAILFRRGQYIHHLMELYDYVVDHVSVSA